ncbi:peptidase M54 [Thermococcus sp.]|uniref:peptidase M54 n=1 Tax=Thermococcus sp. TaxID=35749 RepID=UPI0025F40FED|nr:peptidase M54 [Thermococcus sp.]
MEFIAFTYVGNFVDRKVIDGVVFNVFDEANRFFDERDLPLRFLYIGRLKLEPGYLINLTTADGKVMVYPLEALVELLYSRLLREMEGQQGIRMNKIFALTTFPLVSRNRYFDFYEKFLGIHETLLGLRMMMLSMKPFEPEGLSKLLTTAKSSGNLDADAKRLVKLKLRLFKDRLLKGVLHEVGHSFGLDHCHNRCVMNSPASMEEWDLRVPDYCDDCMAKLRAALKEGED